MQSFVKFQDKPGVFTDDTPLTAAMFYVDSDKIRWERGKWQSIGGWEKATSDLFLGVCRGLFVWRNNQSQPLAAIGTHLGVYAYFDADLYDISTIIERGTVTNPFTTVDTESTVTFAKTAHGLVDEQRIRFPNSTSVNGATISSTSGYPVTVVDANTVTFTAGSAATSSGSGVGGTVDYDFFQAPGLVDGLGGVGFGVGGFGLGGYGEGADINELYPRTHSFDNWGQNLLGCARGGPISEWSPGYANPELVTNGSFTGSSTGWTLGAGWAYGANAVTATASSTALSQNVPTESGTWYLLEFDMSGWSTGTLTVSYNSEAIISAVAANGRYREPFFGTGASSALAFTGTNLTATIDSASVKRILNMEPIPEAPPQNSCMIVTAEDMVMVGGTIDEDTEEFDPLLIRWCARRNNRLWTPGFQAGNTAGKYRLALGSRIVNMINGRGEIVILTDDCIYVGRFNPDPTINYSFTHLGRGNGLIGPNAVTVAGGKVYWIGTGGEFMCYAGGAPEHLVCTVRREFIENLARSQHDKIYATGIDSKNEVMWLYPDSRDGNECSRYIKYNWLEDCWDKGTFDRTAWVDSRAFQFPLATSVGGQLYFQELGKSADGGPLSGFIETGAFSLKDGSIAALMRIIPDFEGLEGGLEMTVKTYRFPSSPSSTMGPYSITSDTRKVDVRTNGRQISLRFEWNSAPMFVRQGTLQGDIRDTGGTR